MNNAHDSGKKPVRVGITALGFATNAPNSHEAHLPQLIRAIAATSAEIQLLVFARTDNLDCFPPASDKVEYVVFPAWCNHKALEIVVEQLVVPFLCVIKRLDLLHFTNNVGPVIPLVRTVGTVHWVRTGLLEAAFPWPKKIYFRALERLSTKRADHLIAVSSACKRDLVELRGIPENRITPVHHGIADEWLQFDQVREETRELHSLPLQPGYVLHVGTSAPYKNLTTLVRAFGIARREYGLNRQLVLVGNVDPEAVTAVARSVGLLHENSENPALVLAGYVPYASMRALYSDAAACVCVSFQETFGLNVLESMAMGLPVVASNIPSLIEVTGGFALLVHPNNPHEIAAAICKAVTNDEQVRTMTQRAKQLSATFTWEAAAQKTIDIYRRVATATSRQDYKEGETAGPKLR